MAARIYTFTEDGGNLFSGRVEYWDDREGIYFFSKVFTDATSRDRWVKDKKRALRLCGPIPPLAWEEPRFPYLNPLGSGFSCSINPLCLAA